MRDKQNYHPDIHKIFTDSSRLYNNFQLRVNKILVKRTKKTKMCKQIFYNNDNAYYDALSHLLNQQLSVT